MQGQSTSARLEVDTTNACGCSIYGTCSESGRCTCGAGYAGPLCSYTTSDHASLTSSYETSINDVESNLATYQTDGALQRLQVLTNTPDLVTPSAAGTTLNILDTLLIGKTTTTSQKEEALSVASSLSFVAAFQPQGSAELGVKLTSSLESISM